MVENQSNVIDGVFLTPIPSSKGLSNYSADTVNGRIWSKKTNKFLATTPNDNGYVYHSLTHDNGERCAYGVHRLIMASVTGIPLEKFTRGSIEVDHYHLEEQKWNNRMDNLQMSSRFMQYRETTRAKMGKGKRLKEADVCEILEQLDEWKQVEDNKISTFIHMIAEAYEQTYRNVHNLVYGNSWKYLYN
jgi:hypothetical protein